VPAVNYQDVPGLGGTQVEGHAGRVAVAEIERKEILVFQGRRHWYEGAGWEPVAIPVYVSLRLGAGALILTNAAGGVRPDFSPGDLMVIDDHINAMGVHPLVGRHDPAWGPRFPDQSAVYDPGLRGVMDQAAASLSLPVRHGVYLATTGPTYETPAEVAAFRRLGADAVGMSTAPEAILGHAAGLRVAGISCIANAASGADGSRISHEEVVEVIRRTLPVMRRLILETIRRI
jgi:purine-nucleoside phosphorylase